jgi:hypothetical protein
MNTRDVIARAIVVATVLVARPAAAGGPDRSIAPTDCMTAYEDANDRLRSSALLEAKPFLLICAKSECGIFLQRECLAAYTRLDTEDIPTVVPVVTDDAGVLQSEVQVTVDGQVLTTRIEGRPLPVDPGIHEFSFSSAGVVFATERVLIVQGKHNRAIAASMHGPVARPSETAPVADRGPATIERPADDHRRPSPYAFVTGGLIGASTFALLVFFGNRDTSSVVTDGSVGLSAGALFVATWLFAADRASAAPSSSGAGFVFDVRPSLYGASVSLARGF